MSEEVFFEDPEIELTAIVSQYKGQPQLRLVKMITSPDKIRILAQLILKDGYIPAKIKVKDKLKFYANLKEKKLI